MAHTHTHKNKTHTVCLFTIYWLPFMVFFSREIEFPKLTAKTLNRTFLRTQLFIHQLKFKFSNQSFKTDMAHTMLFLVFSSCRSASVLSVSLSSKTLCHFASPSLLLSFLFLFLTGDDSSAFWQDSKSPYFPKMLRFV